MSDKNKTTLRMQSRPKPLRTIQEIAFGGNADRNGMRALVLIGAGFFFSQLYHFAIAVGHSVSVAMGGC